MSMRTSKLLLPVSLLALAILTSCSPTANRDKPPLVRPALESEVKQGFSPRALNSVAVLPLEGAVVADRPIAPERLALITQSFIEHLQSETSLQIENIQNPAAASKVAEEIDHKAIPQAERAALFGRKLGVQGVLYGMVTRYDETNPSAVGSPDLSAVSFRLFLLEVKSNNVVWNASFDEANQPLSENLFRLGKAAKEGFRYLSASQLIEKGLERAAADLERVRKTPS